MAHAHKKANPTVTNIHDTKTKPPSRMLAPFEEFEHFFEQLRSRDWMHPLHWPGSAHTHLSLFAEGKQPKVDIIDNEKDLLVRAELPGVEKKDLDISMTDNSVTIKASTNYEDKEEKGNYFKTEIAHGEYLRTIALPAEVDIEQVKSSFKNGVLELRVPKVERSQRRSVKIG